MQIYSMAQNNCINVVRCGKCTYDLQNPDDIKMIKRYDLETILVNLITKYDISKYDVCIENNQVKCTGAIKVVKCISHSTKSVFEGNKEYILCILEYWLKSRPIYCSRADEIAIKSIVYEINFATKTSSILTPLYCTYNSLFNSI